MSVYRQLQEILDVHPASAPASPHFDEILRTLFTNDEAARVLEGWRHSHA